MGDGGGTVVKLFGGLLLAVGILIATASGLCTVAVLTGDRGTGSIPMALAFGGTPFAVGIFLVVAGVAILKSGRRDDPDGTP